MPDSERQKPCYETFSPGIYARREQEENTRERRTEYERERRAALREQALIKRTEPITGTHYRTRTLSSPTVRDLGIVAVYGPSGLPMPYVSVIHRGPDEKT